MRTEITEAVYLEIYNGDLSEVFESFIRQGEYLEVLCCNGRDKQEFIGSVATFDPGHFYNASAWFEPVDMPISDKHPNGYTYASAIAEEKGEISNTYFLYDTLEDAIAHNTELLLKIDRGFLI